MAPSSNSAKSRKPTPAKAGNARPIVPAIPLPHVKRQAAARAAAATQGTIGNFTPASATTAASPSPAKANGHVSGSESTETSKPSALDGSTVIRDGGDRPETKEIEVAPSPDNVQLENGHTDDTASTFDSTNTSTDSPSSSVLAARPDDEKPLGSPQVSPAPVSNSQSQALTSASEENMQPANHKVAAPEADTTSYAVKEGRAGPPPAISPTGYRMPPTFHPAPRPPPGMTGNTNVARMPRQSIPNGPPMHHSHPSNGSAVQFGLYGSSANSSPAPPHSGGIAPPPGMSLSDGRTPYMPPLVNGYPPMIPMGSEMATVSHYDGFTRQPMAYAPPDLYQPYGNTFGPSTPHSLPGSQSSGHLDEPIVPNPYQTGHSRNGPNGFSQDFPAQGAKERMMAQDYVRLPAHPAHQHHLSVQEDNSEGLIEYLRQQFGNPELSDSIVELQYSNNRAAPVRVPGHRLIFARSPVLGAVSRRQSPEQRVFVVETDSKWIRSDAFYMSLQRLYGLPLLPVPPPVNTLNSGDFAEAGSTEERLDFALAYAAAGKLLEWEPVLRRGCEIAAHLLDWQTVEKALDFALEGFVDNGTYESYKYEVGSNILLHGIASFIINNLPPTFSLDATVQESAIYSRLPMDPGTKSKAPSTEAEPIIVRGSQNAQAAKGHRHQLSSIQFGDLSLMEGANGATSDTPKASQQAVPVSHAILSRLLVSVPFGLLKMILEGPGPMNVNGWSHAETRSRIVKEAVIEREARRSRVIDAVMDGRVVETYPVLQQLRAPEPRNLDRWGVLGWQEEVLSHSNGEAPSLARRWAPLRDTYHVPVAEFP
ncbi:hypothetical protein NLU13_7644 [Sarocladium strictum]|uniref:Uncharacterized protein n=1 Tax=Sarocladium strictum TaxID=5046 RepID=A0AA39GDR1_SARSR|nr:hypothetical protein NLU13_7644 [Sarocladium strictum]